MILEHVDTDTPPPGKREEAAGLLRLAAELVEQGGNRDDSAAWRAVDALVLLKALNKGEHLPGVNSRTGRGGRLSIKPRK